MKNHVSESRLKGFTFIPNYSSTVRTHRTGKSVSGFTLVELLVVISIIAILLAVLMPALGRARDQAKISLCKSNLKQLAMAHVMYLNESNYKGLTSGNKSGSGGAAFWMTQLAPYLEQNKINKGQGASNVQDMTKQMKILRCPSTGEPTSSDITKQVAGTAKNRWRYIGTNGGWTNTTVTIEGSYGMNGWVGGLWIDLDDKDGISDYLGNLLETPRKALCTMRSYVPLRSDIPVFADSSWVDFYPIALPERGSGLYRTPVGPPADKLETGTGGKRDTVAEAGLYRICIKRHRMAIDLGFADGHVALVPLTELWNYQWAKTFIKTGYVKVPGDR
ncbi:MAG: hypothetical protein A2Y10_01015 [Planctomycetes bacterium GWF2_41_51]|nr:MAG: hypothetical protein A2Y10_01015 [Planctomycetes bacterium GWF2_41_51]HBG26526.1 hypothetical protein [Phycisphaerales bacterium]